MSNTRIMRKTPKSNVQKFRRDCRKKCGTYNTYFQLSVPAHFVEQADLLDAYEVELVIVDGFLTVIPHRKEEKNE